MIESDKIFCLSLTTACNVVFHPTQCKNGISSINIFGEHIHIQHFLAQSRTVLHKDLAFPEEAILREETPLNVSCGNSANFMQHPPSRWLSAAGKNQSNSIKKELVLYSVILEVPFSLLILQSHSQSSPPDIQIMAAAADSLALACSAAPCALATSSTFLWSCADVWSIHCSESMCAFSTFPICTTGSESSCWLL